MKLGGCNIWDYVMYMQYAYTGVSLCIVSREVNRCEL